MTTLSNALSAWLTYLLTEYPSLQQDPVFQLGVEYLQNSLAHPYILRDLLLSADTYLEGKVPDTDQRYAELLEAVLELG